MKLLLIRHGDPDYEADSLTPKGWREAGFLAQRLEKINLKDIYVSPLGRAKDTASCTLERLRRTAQECEWLREFHKPIWRPDVKEHRMVSWDWLPEDWMEQEQFFHYDEWWKHEVLQEAGVKQEYDWVVSNFDSLLAEHGYRRDGHFYRSEKANSDTLAFFCHFGVGCVLLSHLLNVSPMVLWHGFCAAPTSVTTLTTEERRKGIAAFRMSSYGDISHLNANNEEPSFSARFCECFENAQERHD